MKDVLTAESLTEQTGKVIPFPERSLNVGRTSLTSSDGITYIAGTDLEASRYVPSIVRRNFNTDAFGALQPRDREILNLAFDRISHVLDTQLGKSELSNAFDEWKDTLWTASRQIESLTGSHSKILGMLLSLLRGKDISDFNMETLRIFREATNTLRLPRISKQDARRITGVLVKEGRKVMIPLNVNESEKDRADSLEVMMAQLIAKSLKDQ